MAEIRSKKPSPLMGEGWVGVTKKRFAGVAGGHFQPCIDTFTNSELVEG